MFIIFSINSYYVFVFKKIFLKESFQASIGWLKHIKRHELDVNAVKLLWTSIVIQSLLYCGFVLFEEIGHAL